MPIDVPSRRRLLLACWVLATSVMLAGPAPPTRAGPALPHRFPDAVPRVGVRFEPNVGQAARRVAFVARGGDATLLLTPRAATFSRASGSVRIGFAGAFEVAPEAAGHRAGTSAYFLGEDPGSWRTGVRASTAVVYPRLWPGVRTTFRGHEDGVEYRFRVAPGGDPSSIALTFGDDTSVRVGADGALTARSPGGTSLRQSPAVLFQRIDGLRVPVSGRFVVRPGGEVGLDVGDHDPSVPLVIDPSVRMSTLFGGSGDDVAWAVDLGSNSTFLAGETGSVDLPTRSGALDPTLGGSCDAVLVQINVHKLDPVVNATYLGGGGCDRALGLDVTGNGAATLVGVTDSADLPTTSGAYAPDPAGAHDAWVAQVSPNGSSLTFATYLGGGGDDGAEDVAVDAGVAYVTGSTTSSDFPTTIGAAPSGDSDAFVTAVSGTGTGLVYSRLAGGGADDAGRGIAVAAGGAASVAGWTESSGFPTTGGVVQPAKATGRDAFVMQLTPSGGVTASTFLGGAGGDTGTSIAVRSGVALVGGTTTSTDFPTTGGAYRPGAPGGPADGFLTALTPGVTGTTWSTYVGGSGSDAVEGVTADKKGNVYAVGWTSSPDLPTSAGRFQDGLAGGSDAFLVMLKPTGAAATISTYLGGSADDAAHDVAVESMGEPVLAGATASASFPTAQRPAQPSSGGAVDAFVASITTAKPTRVVLDDAGFTPSSIAAALDTTVQWEMPSSNAGWHSVVDASGTELFGSDAPRPPGSAYSFRFLSGGVYAFEDGETGHAGTVSIPDVAKPRTGSATTTFTVTWCAGQVPAWFVFDVQVQRPGSASWVDLVGPGVTSVSRRFVPDAGTGTYRFRSRVRSTVTGSATGWSPPVSVTVS